MRKYDGKPLSQMTSISYVGRASTYSPGTPSGNRRASPASTSWRSQDAWSCPSGTGKIGIRSRGVHTSA